MVKAWGIKGQIHKKTFCNFNHLDTNRELYTRKNTRIMIFWHDVVGFTSNYEGFFCTLIYAASFNTVYKPNRICLFGVTVFNFFSSIFI